jgi:nitrate/TMAO reductase-like tetraheme cytochrome c subunit
VARFLLQEVPPWIQLAGLFLAPAVALALLFLAWKRRNAIAAWLASRSRKAKLALAALAGVGLLSLGGLGTASWNYMQHDNDFCTGCHVMTTAYVRFAQSEHNELSCHDCHQQSIFASMRQLYLWVAERPEKIGPHSPVPNEVCARCHVTGEGKEIWQRIAATAGHRTHLESDSSTLADIMCVTCHGQEMHRFTPVDQTCGQANCHANTTIELGRMVGQTALHCVTCHQFTAEVPPLATWDSAAAALVPGMPQCFSCHEMQRVLAEFDPAYDPHDGRCGLCHNPHRQATPGEALQSCTSSQCHADWRIHPFHVGRSHGAAGPQCNWCHEPHRARVDASDCVGCHEAVSRREDVPAAVRRRLQRALPFDTGASFTPSSDFLLPPRLLRHRPSAANGEIELWSAKIERFPEFTQDTFSHRIHAELSCLSCHETRTGHGRLTFVPPRGCQACHHRDPATADCSRCHQEELRRPLEAAARFAIADRREHTRNVRFDHDAHSKVRCPDCHTQPVSLLPAPEVQSCTACHDEHHSPARSCASCHGGAKVAADHSPPAEAHVGCDACHQERTVARLFPDRAFCNTCHPSQGAEHHPERECTVCHLQAEPAEFKVRLTGGKRR